jgi:hypothetical protein
MGHRPHHDRTPNQLAQMAEIERRYARGRPPKPQRIKSFRRAQVLRLLNHRHGAVPDDDAGHDALQLLLELGLTGMEAIRIAPWCVGDPLNRLIEAADSNWPFWSKSKKIPEQLAQRLAVTFKEKTMLRLHHIAAIDISERDLEADRRKRRRDRAKQRAAGIRSAMGAVPRAEYLATSKARTKPWEAAGLKRRTWYRRQRASKTNGTGPSPGNLLICEQPTCATDLPTVRQPTCATEPAPSATPFTALPVSS